MGPVFKRARTDELRARIIQDFRGATRLEHARRGPMLDALPTGWEAVDAVFPGGGLAPGETAVVSGPPGAGTLALAAGFARVALGRGEAVAVVDACGTALPHAWLDVPETAPTLWIVAPPTPRQAWPALDIMLRSGGFGLIVALEPGAAPRGAGGRLRRLVQDRQSRLVIVGDAPFTPTIHLKLVARRLEWDVAPTGAAPLRRFVEVRCQSRGAPDPPVEVCREDVATDRLRARPRAPDRRAPSGRKGAARDRSGGHD